MDNNAECNWRKVKDEPYNATFNTDCGHVEIYEKPIEIGFSLTPDAEEFGPYCRYCGRLIKDGTKKRRRP